MPNVAEHMAANIWTCGSCDAGAFPVQRETLHLSAQMYHLLPPLVTPPEAQRAVGSRYRQRVVAYAAVNARRSVPICERNAVRSLLAITLFLGIIVASETSQRKYA